MNVATSAAPANAQELSTAQLVSRQVRGMVAYTLRESLHRWTLIAYGLGVTFFLVILATAVNLDIIEGQLAAARLFGQDIQLGEFNLQAGDIERYFQMTVISSLYAIGVLLALFLTSDYVPALTRQGWVDLLVAQPVARSTLLLGRALGAITVVGFGIGYLVLGSWLVLRLKTGLGSGGFFLAGAVILVLFTLCYSATVLLGIVTRSAPVSGMAGLMVWIAGHVMYPLHTLNWEGALRSGWPRQTAQFVSETLYWFLPKSEGLRQLAVAAARGEPLHFAPVWYSLPFAVTCLCLACWYFTQRDY